MSNDETINTAPASQHLSGNVPRTGPGASLRAELEMLRFAISGAAILARGIRPGGCFETAHDQEVAGSAIPAVLSLVGVRMRQMELVAAGELPVAAIITPDNLIPADSPASGDVVLV